MDKEPSNEGRVLTGKDYMEDLKRYLDIVNKLDGDAKGAIPRRKQIFRVAEKIIQELNDLEIAFEQNPNSIGGLRLIKLHHYYGTDNVEDLAMKMAHQYTDEQELEEFKALTKGVGEGVDKKNAIVDFKKLKDKEGLPGYKGSEGGKALRNEAVGAT